MKVALRQGTAEYSKLFRAFGVAKFKVNLFRIITLLYRASQMSFNQSIIIDRRSMEGIVLKKLNLSFNLPSRLRQMG